MGETLAKLAKEHGPLAAISLGLIWIMHEMVADLSRDIDFLIRLVDSSCGK